MGIEGRASGAAAERDLQADSASVEGGWGWGSLGALEAFCRNRFVELVLGWTVVPGDESRRVKPARRRWMSRAASSAFAGRSVSSRHL